MGELVPLALFSWPLFCLALYALLPISWATALSYSLAWCFLPVAAYAVPGFPDYTKMSATSLGAVLGLAIYHSSRMLSFRTSWIDLPMATYCLCPIANSLSNGLGAYDGFAQALNQVASFGIPYFVGRLSYQNEGEIANLGRVIIFCTLVYVPLCLWEVRMSPQLHKQLYGFAQHSFGQTLRGGGFRPMVFMQHGLQVALWMGASVLLSFICWFRRTPLLPGSLRFNGLVVTVLAVTFLLLKSLGAFLVVSALTALFVGMWKLRLQWLVWLVPVIIVGYFVLRMTGTVTGEDLVTLARKYASDDRAESLQYRFDNEKLLIEKAFQRPFLGWGGWGRNKIHDVSGKDITVTDGFWIIVFGIRGLLGLISIYAAFLIAPVRTLIKHTDESEDSIFPIGLAFILFLLTIDTLPNAMIVPVFLVSLGALSTWVVAGSHSSLRLIAVG